MGLNYEHGTQLFNLVSTNSSRQLCLQILLLHTLIAIPVGEQLYLSGVCIPHRLLFRFGVHGEIGGLRATRYDIQMHFVLWE